MTTPSPMRVADFIWTWLADQGVSQAFVVTGGGAMHLNDALVGQDRIAWLCPHHEQACAIAAEGYARVAGRPAAVCVTAGPGGINTLTGIFGAWTDSIPMIVVSGQVKRETLTASYPWLAGLRQLGDQEADIVGLAGRICKYAARIDDPALIRLHLEKAWAAATTGRPGPVWLDVPIDVQAARIDPSRLIGASPALQPRLDDPDQVAQRLLALIVSARRPILLPGTGVRLANGVDDLRAVAAGLGIPVAGTWTGLDLIPDGHPCFAGRAGTIGDRAGNFTVQNADLVVVLGSRLNIRQVSYNWSSFARSARIVQVDIDPLELQKPTVRPQEGFVADLGPVLRSMLRLLPPAPLPHHLRWLAWCRERVVRYPVVEDRHRRITAQGAINPYHFVDRLYRLMAGDEVVVCGNATASVTAFHAAAVQPGQRIFANSGCAAMGYDLPAAIGAACAAPGRRVVCLAGDGSLMMNIQELRTVAHHRLPVHLFVLNNGGYLSMRLTQNGFFGRRIGESPASGVSFPDFVAVGNAMGMPSVRIAGPRFEESIRSVLATDGPVLAEVLLDPDQGFEPKLGSRQLPDGTMASPALEDMQPFLDRDELARNVLPPDGP